MGIGYSVGWGGFGRDDSEEIWLEVENEVDSENYSSVGKGVKDELVVVFGGNVSVMKCCWWWSWKW